jgi:F420-non-reducing hydrogenase iron-sulfur subunit
MGIEEERLRLEWISASEGDKVQHVMNEMFETIRALGPLRLEPTRHDEAEPQFPCRVMTAEIPGVRYE